MARCNTVLAGLLALAAAWPGAALSECRLNKTAEIPVAMHGARRLRPVIDTRIDGAPARMIVDTGAGASILFAQAAARLGLTPLPNTVEGRSYGQPVQGHMVAVDTLAYANRSVGKLTLFLVDADFGSGIDGLLGDAELGDADIEFDLAHDVIRLFEPVGCEGTSLAYWAQGGPVAIIALEPHAQNIRPFGQAEVNGAPQRVMFDSGSPTSSMTAEAARRADVPFAGKAEGVSRGVGPMALSTWSSVLKTLSIGGEVFPDVTLAVIEKPNASADMLIGADYFVTHRLMLSHSQNKLYATPEGKGGLAAQP